MEDVPQLSFPQVDAGEIIRHVGGAAFARGKAYSSGNAVEDLTWDPDTGVLQSRVNGTAAVPYRCRVQLKKKHDGGYSLLDNSCSCPVGYDCKHVAATLLYGNLMNLRASEEFKLSADPAPFAGYGASASPAIPQWQQALDSLLATGPAVHPEARCQQHRPQDTQPPDAAGAAVRSAGPDLAGAPAMAARIGREP
jgi:hypothetical protein